MTNLVNRDAKMTTRGTKLAAAALNKERCGRVIRKSSEERVFEKRYWPL